MSVLLFSIGIYLVDILIVSLLSKLGKYWIVFCMVVNLLLVFCTGGIGISLFGFDSNVGNIFFAAAMYAASLKAARFKYKEYTRNIFIALAAVCALLLSINLSFLLPFLPELGRFREELITVFGVGSKIAAASVMSAYLSLTTNAFFVDKGRKTFGNIAGQFVDSLVFFPAAFYGVLPTEKIVEYMITGFLFKSFLNTIDYPLFALFTKSPKRT